MSLTTTVLSVHATGALATILEAVVAATEGCQVRFINSPESAQSLLRQGGVGLVVYSLAEADREPELVEFLENMKAAGIRVPLVVIIESDEPQLRYRLLRCGAADCLSPPLDASRLGFLIDFLTLRTRCRVEASPGQAAAAFPNNGDSVGDFLFAAPAMQGLLGQIRPLARLDTTVLIAGETGTGKSHLARVVHELSPRRHRPFAVVHCGALSSTLVRSELFGHLRGSFTGADCDRTGRFADARDGTILIDEIDCLPLDVQANLLRAVEDRVFEPVGSVQSQPLLARLVVTSNQSLENEVAAGRFRADLYHRLNVVSLTLPPLREVPSQIRSLAEKFLVHYCQLADRHRLHLSAQALRAMEHHQWPGNVRELRNMAERAAALCPGPIVELAHLPEPIRRSHPASDSLPVEPGRCSPSRLANARKNVELKVLSDVLRQHKNNRTDAAAALGVSRVTLYRKLHHHGLI